MFLCTFTCLLLTEVGGAKTFHYMSDIFFFSLSRRASPYRDGRMSSVILRPPWWFIEGVHGCMTCSLISGTINEWLEIKWRIKARARSERTVESRKLSFSISEKKPQSLSFNPSWQGGWGSIHLSLSFFPSSSGSVGSCSGGATAWVLRSVFCSERHTYRRDNYYATLNSKSRPNPLSVGSLSTTAAQERLYVVFAMTMFVCVFVCVKFS